MKKTKKKKAGKKSTLLGGAGKSLKRLGKGTANGFGGLSTTQKVMGGAALVALGLNYLNKRRGKKAGTPASTSDATAAEQNLSAMDGSADNPS